MAGNDVCPSSERERGQRGRAKQEEALSGKEKETERARERWQVCRARRAETEGCRNVLRRERYKELEAIVVEDEPTAALASQDCMRQKFANWRTSPTQWSTDARRASYPTAVRHSGPVVASGWVRPRFCCVAPDWNAASPTTQQARMHLICGHGASLWGPGGA